MSLLMNYQDQLDSAISITCKMLSAARIECWDQVIQMEEDRRVSFKLMEQSWSHSNLTIVEKNLQKLILLNEELEKLSVIEMTRCKSCFLSNRNNKKAFNAYAGL